MKSLYIGNDYLLFCNFEFMEKKSKENISELQFIKGVGPVKAKALLKEGIKSYYDLIAYFPRDYVNRDLVANIKTLSIKLKQVDLYSSDFDIKDINVKEEVTVIVKVINKNERTFGKNKKMLELIISDDSGTARIIFWNFIAYYAKTLNKDDNLIVSGKAEIDKYGKITFTHPEIEKFDEEDEKTLRTGGILPVYRMTQAMRNAHWTMRSLRQVMLTVLEMKSVNIKETLPDHILSRFKFPSRKEAVYNLHFPESHAKMDLSLKRMKFEEIFYYELFLAVRHDKTKVEEKSIKIPPKSNLARTLYESLPFELTADQKKVINEISSDMQSGKPMNRLLQGDVGSGKTIVALLTMLVAVDHGCQTVFMAPTEILAEQHFHTLNNHLKDFDINIVQLVGGQRKKARNKILEDIGTGKANIIVGTHAIFESDIVYNKLGFIVIDEQHRFGVLQRAKIRSLANASFSNNDIIPHILVMSATPIPRTLSLTLYGDLDVSIIREKPANRKNINTKVVFESQLPNVFDFIRERIRVGEQVYIVYPLVEKSEKMELKAATEQFNKINDEIFPEFRCALLHGQMFWYQKEDVMKDFLDKKYDILVATTVIEVGIDIPNVTIMMIENAERFGLSQLHQLRGRVGRGEKQSYCFLVTKDNYRYALKRYNKDDERKSVIVRLKTMQQTNDGFEISEVDLKLRGPGDIMGTRQSGLPAFKFIDLVYDADLISTARKIAFSIIKEDTHLRLQKHQIIRNRFIKIFSENEIYYDIA
jgi:ATP-dependent DNA helicase RecG